MEQGSNIKYDEKGVGVRKPYYKASFENNEEYETSIFSLSLLYKQPNGAKVDKIDDYEYDFTKLSNAQIDISSKAKVNDLNLFGCTNTVVFADNDKAERIEIFNTKDSKSEDIMVFMNKGDKLFDATRNVKFTANEETIYSYRKDKGYMIDTELGVAGRRKIEHHDENGKVTTKYYSKDYETELKEDYALSKQRKTSDGYVINTWKNGKISIFDKDGKALPAGTKVKILKTKSGQETVQVMQK
jgi:hypothetical protein